MKRYIVVDSASNTFLNIEDMNDCQAAMWMSREDAFDTSVINWKNKAKKRLNINHKDPDYTIYEIDFENLTIRKV